MRRVFSVTFFLICLSTWIKDAAAHTRTLKSDPEDGKFYSMVFSRLEGCNGVAEANNKMDYFLEIDDIKIAIWVRERASSDQELKKGSVYLLAKMAAIQLGKTESTLNLVKDYLARCTPGNRLKDTVINPVMYERVVNQGIFPIVFEYSGEESGDKFLNMFYLHPDTEQSIRSLLKIHDKEESQDSSAGETNAVADPVADYAEDAASGYDLTNPLDVSRPIRLILFIDDFDSDGIKDIAMSDSLGGAWGNAGGEWKIYLGRKDGKYVPFKQTIFFRPGEIDIQKIKNGTSKITIYARQNASEGGLSEFQMSSRDLRQIKSKVIRPDDNPADKMEYDRLFGPLNKQPIPEFCMLLDYLKQNKCTWKKGY